MRTEEIKESHWAQFCARFEEAHRGAPISMEVIYHDGRTAMIARQEPLESFQFEKTQACNDLIRIKAGAIEHQVIDPIHMRVREQAGNQKLLEIDAESGSVEMRFSSVRIGALLQELQLVTPAATGSEGGRRVR